MDFENLSTMAKKEVGLTMEQLPDSIRIRLQEVPVFLERVPDDDDVAEGIEPDTLGLFDTGEPASPTPRIRLWLENLWDFSESDAKEFCTEVRTTLLHEVGHFLGWEEEDLDERGLG